MELATRLAEDNGYCGVAQSDEAAVEWWQGSLCVALHAVGEGNPTQRAKRVMLWELRRKWGV